ncbi:hypothetical protein DPMN_031248 [Dreissena polymorpha]|uniref:Uncharacterized protein n=1 Tax=Dreissena polymorpha TaxID=45954 RepID=A0A9D4RH52_DREPO|nr:hypothetical protein DPMN_031248 [Dreissena polymorpha]
MMIEEAIWFLGNGEEVATWRISGLSISGATTQQPKGKIVIKILKHCVNSPTGCVPWQDRMVPH